MSSLLSAEMTTTRTKTRKIKSLFHGGRKGKCPHSLVKNIWMDERASSFPGTKSTEKFMRKHCDISSIQGRKDRSLNISRKEDFLQNLQKRRHRQVPLQIQYHHRSVKVLYQKAPVLKTRSLKTDATFPPTPETKRASVRNKDQPLRKPWNEKVRKGCLICYLFPKIYPFCHQIYSCNNLRLISIGTQLREIVAVKTKK